jgi:hypothetical protein
MYTQRRSPHSLRRRVPDREPGRAALPAEVVPFSAPPPPTSLQALVRRHGHHTARQRANLLDSMLRHVNAGHVNLDDVNGLLTLLDLEPLHGPGQVSFRLGVAMRVVHEDDETDAAMLRCRLDEVPWHWQQTTLAGFLHGVRVSLPRAHAGTGRRHTVVSADLRLTVTVPAYTTEAHLVALATALLYDDLRLVTEYVDITDAPTLLHVDEPVDSPTADAPDIEEDGQGESEDTADADNGAGDDAEGDALPWARPLPDSDLTGYGSDDDLDDASELTGHRRRGTRTGEWDDEVFETVFRRIGIGR